MASLTPTEDTEPVSRATSAEPEGTRVRPASLAGSNLSSLRARRSCGRPARRTADDGWRDQIRNVRRIARGPDDAFLYGRNWGPPRPRPPAAPTEGRQAVRGQQVTEAPAILEREHWSQSTAVPGPDDASRPGGSGRSASGPNPTFGRPAGLEVRSRRASYRMVDPRPMGPHGRRCREGRYTVSPRRVVVGNEQVPETLQFRNPDRAGRGPVPGGHKSQFRSVPPSRLTWAVGVLLPPCLA